MRRRRASAALLGAGLALAGCTVGPNFTSPKTPAPPAFGAEPADVASRTYGGAVDAAWWTSFGNAELTSLTERLARQNLDLKAAAERIVQARAERRVTASQGLPHLELQGYAENLRASPEGLLKTLQPAPGAPGQFEIYQDQAQASWEIDLFGRVRRAVEAQSANVTVQTEARHALALSALAELAQDYLQLRGLQVREAVIQHNLDLTHRREALVRDRFANGVATNLDVAQADAQAASIAEDLPTLHTEEARLTNALALLLAEPPRALEAELKPAGTLPARPPAVPVGLPSELLRRRPDVREAEARLHVATAQTGVAVADFFPQVSLSGSFGTQSLSTSNLFTYGARSFMAGPSITVPLFEGGRLKGELDLRKSEQREAALAYQQAVLQAWHDVDNALTAYAEGQHRRADTLTAVRSNQVALLTAEQRYSQGADTFLDVIAAQGAVLQTQDALAQVEAQLDVDLVTLYRALGGGWQAVDPPGR